MFELLFKYPLTVYRKGDFVFSSGWPVWLLIALIAAAGAALFWHVNKNRARFEGRRPLAIWAFQAASVALILFLLWQPAISINSLRNQQNVVAVLLDTSRSMALAEDGVSRFDAVRTALSNGVLGELEKKFRVRLYSFSGDLNRIESLDAAPPPGNSTHVGEAVAAALRESSAVPLGAVVVFSDGSDNTGAFNRDLMAEIRKRNVPVHTVGVGRTEMPEDVELSDVNVAAKALPNSRAAAHVTIRHSGAQQQTTKLTVRDGSRIIQSREITLKRGNPVQMETVDFPAGEPGIRNLNFQIEPVNGEKITGNNMLARVVDVPTGRRRILYVEGEPRWELKFMRRAIEKDASVQLVSMLRTTPNKFYRQGVDGPEELENGFPSEPDKLYHYEALILGSIEAASFSPLQQQMIKDFVSQRGGTLLMLGGKRGLSDGGWGASKVAEMLPVRLPEKSTTDFVREKVPVELTVQGQDSLITKLDEDSEKNRKMWAEMPALADYQRVGELKPAAVPLLEIKLGERRLPLLVTQNYGRGKTMVLATGGTWRWQMQLPHEDLRHETFWQQLLRSLVTASPPPVTITSTRTLYADEPTITVRAEVRTKNYDPANNATVTAVITPETGDAVSVDLHPSPEEPGVYETFWTAARPGIYRVEVNGHLGNETLGSDVLHLRREDGVAEDFHPEQNRELLTKLAEQTGGRYWTLDEIAKLPEEVRFSEAGITGRESLDLWDMPFLFLLLLALRGGEWLLRRKWGAI